MYDISASIVVWFFECITHHEPNLWTKEGIFFIIVPIYDYSPFIMISLQRNMIAYVFSENQIYLRKKAYFSWKLCLHMSIIFQFYRYSYFRYFSASIVCSMIVHCKTHDQKNLWSYFSWFSYLYYSMISLHNLLAAKFVEKRRYVFRNSSASIAK